jgi:EAL domain-containing protein (putative c-di-GMP-specific phosphodiesterase class I)
MHVSASVGVSMFPADGDTGDLLLRNADASMYRAKDEGRNCARFYTREMSALAQQRVALESALHCALEESEFELHYQPIVDMQGTIIAVEALLRWTSSSVGTVSPGNFIPVAEETGLIAPIGEWVMRTACTQLKAWHADGLRSISVAVNVSVRQIELHDVPGMVESVLRETGIEPKHLELELTESALMKKSDKLVGALYELNRMGVRLSLDDFGTGYSSLSYLRRFPIDSIKIDRSFIDEVMTSSDDAAISKAIIAMAHSLGIKTVAEGVETERQVEFLKAQRCHAAQGYFYSPALPAKEITALLLQRLDAAA